MSKEAQKQIAELAQAIVANKYTAEFLPQDVVDVIKKVSGAAEKITNTQKAKTYEQKVIGALLKALFLFGPDHSEEYRNLVAADILIDIVGKDPSNSSDLAKKALQVGRTTNYEFVQEEHANEEVGNATLTAAQQVARFEVEATRDGRHTHHY